MCPVRFASEVPLLPARFVFAEDPELGPEEVYTSFSTGLLAEAAVVLTFS